MIITELDSGLSIPHNKACILTSCYMKKPMQNPCSRSKLVNAYHNGSDATNTDREAFKQSTDMHFFYYMVYCCLLFV